MKTLSILLTLCASMVAAQTVTSTSTNTVSQSSTVSTTPASTNASTTTTTLSIWLNTTITGAPIVATLYSSYCGTIEMVLNCTNTASCDSRYDGAYYSYGSDFFGSLYGTGIGVNVPNYDSTQSCTLMGTSGSSYFSCQGEYSTTHFINSSFATVTSYTSSFTWPTSAMLSTGIPASTQLPFYSHFLSCTRSAAIPAVDAKRAFALAAFFCTVLLGVLV